MTDEQTEPAVPHAESPDSTAEVVHTPAVENESAVEASDAETVADVAMPDASPESTVEGEPVAEGEGGEPESPSVPATSKRWYAVKVQSGREESIKASIERRVRIEGLEEFFSQIVIPIEKKVTVKDGRRITRKTKKLPGYLMAEVEFNDQILYLFRETSGVGDFVGHNPLEPEKKPIPMTDAEVRNMLDDTGDDDKGGEKPQPTRGAKVVKAPTISKGDRVRVKDGMFTDMEGTVREIVEPTDGKTTYKVVVELTIWGRPTRAEFDPLQVELA